MAVQRDWDSILADRWGRIAADMLAHGKPLSAKQKAHHGPNAKPTAALLVATQDSSCFVALYWRDGVAFATFTDGSRYQYDMTREEFLDWRADPSLGKYFNAVVRE